MPTRRRWSDEEVEAWIGSLLRYGVLTAAAVALVGGLVYTALHAGEHVDYRTFRAVTPGLDSVHGVFKGVFQLRSRWIIQLGLLLLIATPVARVALSLVAFLLQRDRMYVVVTAIVLGLLLFSLFGPGVG